MNVRDLLRELRVPFREHGEHPKVSEGWIGTNCPYCGHGPFYLGIHVATGRVSCWACGKHHLAYALSDICGISRQDAFRLTDGLDRIAPPDRPPAGRLVIPDGVCELLPAHKRYLARRRLDVDEMIELWRLQGFGPVGRYRWRIFVPIHQGDRVVSWTTRAIGDVPFDARYRSASRDESAVPRSEVLFGERHARQSIVWVEGPFDAFRVGPGAVCSCGIGYSRAQVRRAARYPVRAVCADNEPAAQRRARRLADELAAFPGQTHLVTLTSGPDPADAADWELKELRRRFLD